MSSMPHNWDDEAVNRYLSLRQSQLSEYDFHRIHHPIDKILVKYTQTSVGDKQAVTQEEFRDAIITADLMDPNRIIILEGEVGGGKSHLCTWLRYELGETLADGQDDRVAFQVDPGIQTFDDVLVELSELVEIDNQPATINEVDSRALAEAVVTTIQAFGLTQFDPFSEKEMVALTESREEELDLTSIIEDNIRMYQSNWPSEVSSVPKLIDRDEYRQLLMVAFDEPPNEQGFELFSTELNNTLTNILYGSSLSDRLSLIADAAVAEGFRPVLICGDISEIMVFREALLEYGTQLQSGHYDIVIGWPTGWINQKQRNRRDDIYTSIRENSEGYFRISDDQGETSFLTKDTVVSLVERYVQAIQSESNVVFTDTVRPESFGGLYPFNTSFVRRLYTHLQQEEIQKRTPRLLLRAIRECLLASNPPFETVEQLTDVESVQEPILMGCSSTAASLTKWYGMKEEGRISVPRGIFETFDVDIPAGIRQNVNIKIN